MRLFCIVQPKVIGMSLSVADPREQPIESIREGQVVYLRLKVWPHQHHAAFFPEPRHG